MDENSFGAFHQTKCPILYPSNAPSTEPIVQRVANLNAFLRTPKTKAINNASGGMGKKDASANAKINKTQGP